MPENTVNITAGDNASFEGVAIGDRNKIISHVQAQGHVVQADHSQVHIGDIYYYFEIPKSDVITKEPYKFLSTYGLADEDIFFGRKQAIADLSSQILDHKLVIINGKSGSGKSSLMHAGVTPKLLRNNHLVIHITDYVTTPVTTIQEAMQGGLESPVVIFLDQFERFFIYLPLPEQQRFTAAFKAWLADENANVRFVIAIRMDFFGRLGEFQPVIPNLYQQSAIFTLLPLNRDEAKEAIEGPLEALNIRIVYEPELLNTLLDSLLEESEIEPAQLQIVCDELYRRTLANNAKIINAALYEAAGGVKGMLENYLQRKLAEYTPNDDEVKAILKQMIAPVEVSAGIRSFVAATQLSERLKLPPTEVERLITRLVDDRLIEQKPGEDTYSIAHEYLAGQVQQWFDPRETAIRRARDILDHAVRYETLMPYQEASQVKEYASDLELNDTERTVLQRSLRKHTLGVWLRWGIVMVITLFAVIAAGLGLYANLQAQKAKRQEEFAFIKTLESQALLATYHPSVLDGYPVQGLLLAAQALTFKDTSQTLQTLQRVLEATTMLYEQIGTVTPGQTVTLSADAMQIVRDVMGGTRIIDSHRAVLPDWVPPDPQADGQCIALSPDGKRAITGSAGNTMILWDVAAGRPIKDPWQGHQTTVTSVAFSLDGQYVISGGKDGDLILWSVGTGQPIWKVEKGHRSEVTGVAVSGDGKSVISGCRDKTLSLWDITTRQRIGKPWQGHHAAVASVAFRPDGKYIISVGNDGEILRWPLRSSQQWIDLACQEARRNLFPAEWRWFISEAYPYEAICPEQPHVLTHRNRQAIMIGIDEYQNQQFNLQGCANDTLLLQQILQIFGRIIPHNFRVVNDEDATQANILEHLDRFVRTAQSGEQLVFFYAAHGAAVKDQNGDEKDGWDEVLIPHDLNPFTDDLLREHLNRVQADIVLILDTRHSGGFADDFENLDQVTILASSQASQDAEEIRFQGTTHGAFTYFLTRGLQGEADSNHDRRITVSEAFEYTKQQLRDNGYDQTPVLKAGRTDVVLTWLDDEPVPSATATPTAEPSANE